MKGSIWYISKYFAPKSKTSPGSRGWFLMKEIAKKGYDVVVITSDSNNLYPQPLLTLNVTIEDAQGVKLVWLKTLKYNVAKSFLRILTWCHFEWNLLLLDKALLSKPDVIVVSSLSLLTVVNGLWLKHKYKCTLVFEVRDIWPLTLVEEGGFSKWNPFVLILSLVERLGYRYADRIVGTMPNLREHVSDVLGYEKEVYCIPMGIDMSSVNDVGDLPLDYKAKYLNPDKFKVIHAGTIGITNALETFFQTADLMKTNERVEFVLVGDGALKQHYIEKYGYLQNLTFAPKVSKNLVHSVLSSCDLLYFSVHDSKVWDYGQSLNKVIDYMLAGKPVVASYSGFPSMINEAECGVFVPASDSRALAKEIYRYLNLNSQERSKIGLRGREWIIKNRSYEKLAEDYILNCFPKL